VAVSTDVGLPVASVARRLGVAPATLRTWDRRYGVGPTSHTAGAHRRYSAGDLARLEVMQRLLHAGVSARDAARQALGDETGPDPDPPLAPARATARTAAVAVADVIRGIGRASTALDGDAVTRLVREQVDGRGVLEAWDLVLRPVLQVAGERWAATGRGVEVEHLLAQAVTGVLQQAAQRQPVRTPIRPLLLAGPPGELHTLPQHALAAALAERGLACQVLGASLPVEALVDAIRRTGPSVLFLWSQLPPASGAAVLAALPTTRPRTAVVLGGPGWAATELPERTSRAGSLEEALSLVLEAAGH
jgi:DNA-binding transcriptional MerR regulator